MNEDDLIEPAPKQTPSIPSHRNKTDGSPIPKSEYKLEHVKEVLQQIQHFCVARGERIEVWMDPVFAMMKKEQVDFGRTWDATRVLLDRLMRGEFLLFFSESARIDRINPLFQPEFVVILKRGAGSTIQHSLRPSVSSDSHFVLPKSYYISDRQSRPPKLTRKDFKEGIEAISKAYHELHPQSAPIAKDWENAVLKASKGIDGIKTREMCWKLIVVGEKVRTGEKLPKVEDLLHGHIEPPRNVNPSDSCFAHSESLHSLGRIGIRQARRIGHEGPLAREGGMHFF
ncbi:hypothetical protein JCM5353_006371 [Sporobolomyces roseus]